MKLFLLTEIAQNFVTDRKLTGLTYFYTCLGEREKMDIFG